MNHAMIGHECGSLIKRLRMIVSPYRPSLLIKGRNKDYVIRIFIVYTGTFSDVRVRYLYPCIDTHTG